MELFWINDIAGSRAPRSSADIDALKADGISAILSLTETPLPEEWTRGLLTRHIPIVDFTAPTQSQLHDAVAFLDTCREKNVTPVVHCTMGYGRTGTILAAWLVAHGDAVDDAVDAVRTVRPGAIETDEQLASLVKFAHTYGGES